MNSTQPSTSGQKEIQILNAHLERSVVSLLSASDPQPKNNQIRDYGKLYFDKGLEKARAILNEAKRSKTNSKE